MSMEIAMVAVTNDKIPANRALRQTTALPSLKNSYTTNVPAPAIAGIDNNIEKRADSIRSYPRILAAVIVTPAPVS